jgi:hypothetical protein
MRRGSFTGTLRRWLRNAWSGNGSAAGATTPTWTLPAARSATPADVNAAGLELRVRTLEGQLAFQHDLLMRTIDLTHERDRLREAQDQELHLFVQQLAHRTGVTLAVHRDDIKRLVKLVMGKAEDQKLDMRATNIWVPK